VALGEAEAGGVRRVEAAVGGARRGRQQAALGEDAVEAGGARRVGGG
jgi:hypothetical protein